MMRVIDGVTTNIGFTNHSIDRFDRNLVKQCRLIKDDIIPVFYHNDKKSGDSLVWVIQDFLKIDASSIVIIIDETSGLSLVTEVFYDIILDELNIQIITVWDGLDIRIRFGQNVIRTV